MDLATKLNPGRFTEMSGKMAAIVGCIIGEKFTEPQMAELIVTTDGFLQARLEGDIGFNEFIGAFADLERNWHNLLESADLEPDEKELAKQYFAKNIQRC